jgi:hypothetical protein
MPHIVESHITTKKMLKAYAQAWNEKTHPTERGGNVYFADPSIFPGARDFSFDSLPEGGRFSCTDHPKRSWFASVAKRDGKIIIT